MSEIINSNLSNQIKFRLKQINKIKDYFNSKIQERIIMIKKLRKYIAAFDCIDKTFIVLSTTRREVSISSFASVIGPPAGIASASFTLVFSSRTGAIKKVLKITRNKKKKHNKTVMLTRNELNSIETLI